MTLIEYAISQVDELIVCVEHRHHTQNKAFLPLVSHVITDMKEKLELIDKIRRRKIPYHACIDPADEKVTIFFRIGE